MTDWGAEAGVLRAELSACSEPGPGVTRLPFTPEHRATLKILTARMEAAGLTVTLDAAGTLIGRAEEPPGSKTLLLGSHQDSVREGGAYDGIMGVVLPLLALEKLRADGSVLPVSVEILAFADEEGVRFPTALVGSRALAGTVDPAVLEMCDATWISLRTVMREFGLDPDQVHSLGRKPSEIMGFIETHIEQGPVLERADQPLGLVTSICGIERHQITLTGETGHAGTLPMEGRRDALVGAAALVTEVNRLARTTPDLRGTVGAREVSPNVVNAVPREVRMTAEFRSPEDDTREAAGAALHCFAEELAVETGLRVICTRSYAQPA
ncbi:hydantoinase/carbamoylase family amidase [Palleronia caenipelagi]|uniref:hydantoinase/carbamoylase family amidase n=1 Tax=Palleronia caenipelagi TaxID=2489174 RepID=UPI001FE55A51|nr:hydantoinase/carbamoylase family amidase [Palleronia caenipelagi]